MERHPNKRGPRPRSRGELRRANERLRSANPAPEDVGRAVRNAADVLLDAVTDEYRDPRERLECAQVLVDFLDDLASCAIGDARALGMPWREIGALYGLSGPGVRKRYLGLGAPPASAHWVELGEELATIRASGTSRE